MSAKFTPITIYRNAGWSMTLELWKDVQRKIPFLTAGYTGKSQMRSGEGVESTLLADIDVDLDQTATGNTITLSIPQETLTDITASKGYFDVLLLTGGSDPFRLPFIGPCEVLIKSGETS